MSDSLSTLEAGVTLPSVGEETEAFRGWGMATVSQVRYPYRAEWVLFPRPREQHLEDPRERTPEIGKAGGTRSPSGWAVTEAHGREPQASLSQFWRLDVQGRGAGRLGVW